MKLRITSKLLLAILLTNMVVIIVLALYLRTTFERGFIEYLNQAEAEQLAPLVTSLAGWHARGGELEDLKYDLRQWHDLLIQSLPGVYRGGRSGDFRRHESEGLNDREAGFPDRPPPADYESGPPDRDGPGIDRRRPPPRTRGDHPPPPPRGGFRRDQRRSPPGDPETAIPDLPPPSAGSEDRPAGPDDFRRNRRPPMAPVLSDPSGLVTRIRLLDADKLLLLGQDYPFAEHAWLPIVSDGQTVGWLTLAPSMIPVDGLAAQFKTQQDRALAIIGMLAILVSVLVAFVLTRNLLRPIRRLTEGAHKLTAGAFDTRIKVSSGDELGQLAKDFNTLAHTLEANETARRQWVADISHELRTPLAVLRGEIEALQDGVREAGPQRLRSLHAEVLSLGKLVDDLYELSLSDIGALSYHKEEIDLANVIQEVVNGFGKRFGEKGVDLQFDAARTPKVQVFADAGRLEQLFSNLLENSLRYTDAGGEAHIFIELQKDKVFIHIQDSLPGVPVEMLPKLFERLFRVDDSRSRAYGGAGLGLSICRNIVDAHDGRIEASSSPAGGLWVSIQLPRVG